MKKVRKLVCWMALVLLIGAIGGCAYVNTKVPFDIDLNHTELGTKTGTAQAYSLLWLVAWGDASYAKAAQNGNIKVINHADQHVFQVLLGLFTRWQVIVYGD